MTTQPHECELDGKMKPASQYICELAAWGQKLEARVAELECHVEEAMSLMRDSGTDEREYVVYATLACRFKQVTDVYLEEP